MNMRKQNILSLKNDQNGFASMVIALVLILVLSLITVGFAQLARREQQTALNKQLAAQAYFAAESGVNDVIKALPSLEAQEAATPGSVKSNKCLTAAQLQGRDPNISNNAGVSYSCALVQLENLTGDFGPVTPGSSRSLLFSTNVSPSSLSVSWTWEGKKDFRPSPGSCSPTQGKCFPPTNKWGNSPSLVQFSLTPLKNLNRTSMLTSTFTAYLYPSADGGAAAYNPGGGQGPVIGGNCKTNSDDKQFCKVIIDNLAGTGTPGSYYLARLTTLYGTETNISIGNVIDTDGSTKGTLKGQPKIDVTGKARTVLKRIQVRISETGNSESGPGTPIDFPDNAIEAGDACKRPAVYAGFGQYYNTSNTPASVGDACDVN